MHKNRAPKALLRFLLVLSFVLGTVAPVFAASRSQGPVSPVPDAKATPEGLSGDEWDAIQEPIRREVLK